MDNMYESIRIVGDFPLPFHPATYIIPENCTVEIKDGKIIVKEKESEDERINKAIFKALSKKDARAVLLAEGVQVSEALAYLEKQKEQKPAKWKLPEDFEEAVYKVANFISLFNSQDELRRVSHRFAEQLMSLAKKELDKPAEWSEEDEKKLEDLTSLLAILEGCSTVNVGTAAKYNGWINSFRGRPKSSDNWKPSKEQLDSLRNTIALTKGSSCSKCLPELYEDLKKLM